MTSTIRVHLLGVPKKEWQATVRGHSKRYMAGCLPQSGDSRRSVPGFPDMVMVRQLAGWCADISNPRSVKIQEWGTGILMDIGFLAGQDVCHV